MASPRHSALSAPRALPDDDLESSWSGIHVDSEIKRRLLHHALLALTLRRASVSRVGVPIHGLIVLSGPPGTGKTTLARGAANELAKQMRGKLGKLRLVELNPHSLTSELLGQTQRAVVKILENDVPALAEDGPLVLLLDEVEALAAARSTTSLETNPVDVHRATNAVLTGIDRLSADLPELITIATTNFEKGVDEALLSRADLVLSVPLPGEKGVHAILMDTIDALAKAYPALKAVAAESGLVQVARKLTGFDGRRIRKFVIEALARDIELTMDPSRLRLEDLLRAADAATAPLAMGRG